jgi:hypothetical protein
MLDSTGFGSRVQRFFGDAEIEIRRREIRCSVRDKEDLILSSKPA